MPEGPETRIFINNLINEFENCSITNIEIIGGRYLKTPIYRFNEIKFPLNNLKFCCKGKFIFWKSDNPNINLCFTLGMTGAFAPQSKHSALKITFNKGEIFWNDPRRFGTFRVFNKNELDEKLNSLGWDVLQEEIPKNIIEITRKFGSLTLAELLMNQNIQSGIGNYIKNEACYRAKILPMRQVSSLKDEEIILLYKEIKNVVEQSYQEGGASIKTFADMYGNIGKFFDKFLIYGKKKDPLDNDVKKITTADKRTTFYVEGVQK